VNKQLVDALLNNGQGIGDAVRQKYLPNLVDLVLGLTGIIRTPSSWICLSRPPDNTLPAHEQTICCAASCFVAGLVYTVINTSIDIRLGLAMPPMPQMPT
jgi:hypothetical protein